MRHTLNWLIRGLVSQRPSRRRGARNYTAPPAECLETRKNLSAASLTSALLFANQASPVATGTAPSRVAQVMLTGTATSTRTTATAPSHVAEVLAARTIVGDPNDQLSEAMNLGSVTSSSTVSGTIDSPKDVDMFRFTVTAGQRLSFDIDVSGRLDSVIRLFDSSGRELARNDDGAAPGESSSLASYLEYTFTSGGTFYLGVSGYRNSSYNPRTGTGDTNGSTGDYELTVKAIGGGIDREDNNTPSQANDLGSFGRGYHAERYSGDTGTGSDTQDWFRFRVSGYTSGTIEISGMSQDLDLGVYNSSGRLVGRSINIGTSRDTVYLNSLPAGTYYVCVLPGDTGARSAYTLELGLAVR